MTLKEMIESKMVYASVAFQNTSCATTITERLVTLHTVDKAALAEAKLIASEYGLRAVSPYLYEHHPAPVKGDSKYWRNKLAHDARAFHVSREDVEGLTEEAARKLLKFAGAAHRDNLNRRGHEQSAVTPTTRKEDHHG